MNLGQGYVWFAHKAASKKGRVPPEHTLVPIRRDHGFAMLVARFGVGSLAELVAP